MLSSETLLFPTQQHKKQERPFSSLLKAAFFIGLSSYEQERIAAEKEAARVANMTPEKRLIHELTILLDQYDNLTNKLGTAAKEIQSEIQRQVKKMLNHDNWYRAGIADRQEALKNIECAISLLTLLNKNTKKKRLKTARALLEAKNNE